MKAYPDLKEYVWQKNASAPPHTVYDKIGLHRLVKTSTTPKGVVFITNCPMWGMCEQRISNPPTENWTKYESYSQAIYWANRGFDVYAIDFRSQFVPDTLSSNQLSFAGDWGWGVWISDMKEAAEKVKEVSGSKKFFISGECSGGQAALNYAVKYWKDDLRGIILLDANFHEVGYPIVGRMVETNTYNMTKALEDMQTAGNWTMTTFAALKNLAQHALENPSAPAVNPATNQSLPPPINPMTNKTWTNITEWFNYRMHYNFGFVSETAPPGMFSNLLGGNGNISQVVYHLAEQKFVPWRLWIETEAMIDWMNCPYLTYDFNDHYNEIGVPMLAFAAGLFSNRTGELRFVNGINNTDFTAIMLQNYGHSDVYFGTYSARDVSEPAYQWMMDRLLPVEKGSIQGYYRDWKIVLWENRIYVCPQQPITGVSPCQCIGVWDAAYYAKLGKTIIDAAKPAIDECINGCR